MPKFLCPGNEADGPCGQIVEGERRDRPDSAIVKLKSPPPCRRLWVFYDECIIREPTHLLEFKMVACHKHFFKGHKWWCKRCDKAVEDEFRNTAWALWELQGAGDRIVRDTQV